MFVLKSSLKAKYLYLYSELSMFISWVQQGLNAHEPEKEDGGGNGTPSSGGLRGQGICHEL